MSKASLDGFPALAKQAFARLDEEFGVGMFEDDDFSLRARKAGYRVVCAEDAYVHHVGQGSFGKLSPAEYDRLWKKNQAYFEKKWGIQWKAHVTRDGVAAPVSKIGQGPALQRISSISAKA